MPIKRRCCLLSDFFYNTELTDKCVQTDNIIDENDKKKIEKDKKDKEDKEDKEDTDMLLYELKMNRCNIS